MSINPLNLGKIMRHLKFQRSRCQINIYVEWFISNMSFTWFTSYVFCLHELFYFNIEIKLKVQNVKIQGGARDAIPSIFTKFSGEIWPNKRLLPPPWGLGPSPPGLGNPGSATGKARCAALTLGLIWFSWPPFNLLHTCSVRSPPTPRFKQFKGPNNSLQN